MRFTHEGVSNVDNSDLWSQVNPFTTLKFVCFNVNVWGGVGNIFLRPHLLQADCSRYCVFLQTLLGLLEEVSSSYATEVMVPVRRNHTTRRENVR